MELSKNGFIYKVAYGYRGKNFQADKTNLCRLFWTFTISVLFVWPAIIIAIPLCLAIAVLSFIIGATYGFRPAVFSRDSEKALFVPYTHWPKWRGHNIPPIVLPIMLVSGYIFWHVAFALMKVQDQIQTGLYMLLINHITWFVVTMLLPMVLLMWLIRALWRGGVFSLITAYFRAKKEKVCPFVVFVEKES